MASPAADEHPPWSRAARLVAAVGWASFLAACLGTLLAFAAVDPQWLIEGIAPAGPPHPPWLTHTGVYTLGFFLFWLVGACAAGLAAWLLRDAP
jgi:hypothetical protein